MSSFRPYVRWSPRSERIGIEERTLYTGEVVTPLNEQEAAAAVRKLKAQGVEASRSASCTPTPIPATSGAPPRSAREIAPDMFVTASHEILPVWREFERFNTTAVGAYVGPAVERYLTSLEQRLKESGFTGTLLMMLADGLVQNVSECVRRAVFLMHSGPAAAPSGAVYIGAPSRRRTSFRRHGRHQLRHLHDPRGRDPHDHRALGQRRARGDQDGRHLELGAGGGSIAWIDSLGLLRVGPESAGADPGRPATAAATSRPSPTPIWCSAMCRPTTSSAARSPSTPRRARAR